MLNKHKGAGAFWRGGSGPHTDPVYVVGPGFVLSQRCLTPSPWDKRWLMPLNEQHFNGSRLLKHFIRVSSGLSTHSSPCVPHSRNGKAVETPFEVGSACKNSIPQSIRHGNLISSHLVLSPDHFETLFSGHIWGWSLIPYKYQRHQSAVTLRVWQLRSRFGLKPWMYPDHSFSSCVPCTWPVSTVCFVFFGLLLWWEQLFSQQTNASVLKYCETLVIWLQSWDRG